MNANEKSSQLVREASIALPILGLLLLTCVFVGYRRISGWADAAPAFVPDSNQTNQAENNSGADEAQQVAENNTSQAGLVDAAHRLQVAQANTAGLAEQVQRARSGNAILTSVVSPVQSSERVNRLPGREPREDRQRVATPAAQVPVQNQSVAGPLDNSTGAGRQGLQAPVPHATPPPIFSSEPGAQPLRPAEPANPLASQEHANATSQGTNAALGIRLAILADDSYWSISERAYGTGQFFRALHAWLDDRGEAGTFREGSILALPQQAELVARYRDLCPEASAPAGPLERGTAGSDRVVVMTSGRETLFEVAAEYLGQASRYQEVVALNRERLPAQIGPGDRLPGGIRLQMPYR